MVENARSLKWHKFLIYFGLWASGISSVLGGLVQLTVMNEFQLFPAWLTTSYGVALIVLGCYCIYVRFQLAGFKKNAPQKLLLMFLATAIIQLAYIVIVAMSLGVPITSVFDLGTILGLVAVGIMLWLHKIYYDKRKELFTN